MIIDLDDQRDKDRLIDEIFACKLVLDIVSGQDYDNIKAHIQELEREMEEKYGSQRPRLLP